MTTHPRQPNTETLTNDQLRAELQRRMEARTDGVELLEELARRGLPFPPGEVVISRTLRLTHGLRGGPEDGTTVILDA